MSESKNATEKMPLPDTEKIRSAIKASLPLSITTYTLPHEMEIYMNRVLTIFLHELDQDFMTEYLTYCLNELITNSKKANTKRIYFREKDLDITDMHDYTVGMEHFKHETLGNIDHYLVLQKQAGLYVKLILQAKNNKIKLEIRNNCELTVYEYKRMHDKLSRAQQYHSIEDAMTQLLDETEGAGLGLIILILMLQKIGLTDENFQIVCENGETITRIILPMNENQQNQISSLSAEIANQIQTIPKFPENITTINRLLNDPDSKLSDIVMHISNDVSLTTDLLRMVNSAAFGLNEPCTNVAAAVKLIGLRGIKNLMYSIGTLQNLDPAGSDRKELWDHSARTAFYAYNLSRNFCRAEPNLISVSYVCGLLHDIGKIVFDCAHPDLISKLQTLCTEKNIPQRVLEKIIAGVNHAEIGALVTRKWNFPEIITDVIKYHHLPECSAPENRKLVQIVYLANLLTHYQKGEVDFYQFDPDVLAVFKISSEEQLKIISDKLQEHFEQHPETP
ncbi:HDOD domain-containing protein [Treponema brennaborense]|uniref:Signal transduction protein n=1 Tax=Treponema brennaborense (strain DSM 12168 / CIP 105900 / DD5/3) TaxID=906968 RepID=F4LNE6_TREBD|nr:HDOD domain-containing protein [Treponema brennaborense]AEE17904.1 putative signal transduction protein [Treponema brennaborense DSM 12168]